MQHPGFFNRPGPFTLDAIASAIGAKLSASIDGSRTIEDVRPLQCAGPQDVTFFDNRKYATQLGDTTAGACILAHSFAERLPKATVVLTSPVPYKSFARALTLFYSDALRSKAASYAADRDAGFVHRSAEIGEGVTIEPGAIVGREAVIGAGTTVAAGAVIGYRVVVGSNGYIGANSTVTHCIMGDGVIIHPGVRIGQDGFGFAMGANGHEKIPQIGRVIIGSDVEIGANSTIDRGSLADTVIGAGTKIDNLVQIGHNVIIGRHCVIVAQSGDCWLYRAWRLRCHGGAVRSSGARQCWKRRPDRRNGARQGRRRGGSPHGRDSGCSIQRLGTRVGRCEDAWP